MLTENKVVLLPAKQSLDTEEGKESLLLSFQIDHRGSLQDLFWGLWEGRGEGKGGEREKGERGEKGRGEREGRK